MFIATANILSTIPSPLRDRMEVIEVPGYAPEEKLTIARTHLLPKQAALHGLPEDGAVEVTDEALAHVVARYTREAGVRGLERRLGAVCRAVAVRVAEDREKNGEDGEGRMAGLKCVIDVKDVEGILGVNAIHVTAGNIFQYVLICVFRKSICQENAETDKSMVTNNAITIIQ